ncbi:helix-turn-helix transcriptional regulator [Cohnella nanjingensis]|uniref:Helix-turn-helix transcriptional regulator n=2 Tax=Cohnella nanjingensis TaxID=1387779 RepID=A0A7X0RM61_9BACL|nr:helix-turn-helix transcriptional regulator [Cohnella nanjingensis]
MAAFGIRLPQFTRLAEPAKVYDALQQLTALESNSHLDAVRWKQQRLFQDVLGLLAESLDAQRPKPGEDVADRAASYLRLNYREPVTAAELGEALRFHPVYVARCMRQRFGCSPMEYLMRYRLEQAKRLLLQTDLPVHLVARETGFQQAAYFTSCFRKLEGLTPRDYRMIFHKKG